MVESAGWMYALKMLKNSFKRAKQAAHNEHIEWQLHKDDHNLSLAQQAEFAYGVLKSHGHTAVCAQGVVSGSRKPHHQ